MSDIFLKVVNNLIFLLFISVIIIVALLVSWKISLNTNIGWVKISINEYSLSWVVINSWENKKVEVFLKNNDANFSDWMTFLSILSTFLAAFFIYSSWKIDNDLTKISNVKESLKNIENEALDNTEFSIQIKYAIHYMMSKQYNKAIDTLIVLKAEPFTIKDDRKLNSCFYFLAVCNYEQWLIDNDVELLAKAVQFINEAIEDEKHPLRIEIIAKFNEMNKIQSV